MPSESEVQRNLRESQILSHKINLLLDVVVPQRGGGDRYEFKEIQGALAEQGIQLSRTRWQHIKQGTATVRQPQEVLTGLADFFGVDQSYLLEPDGETPERIQHELELLAAMRRAKVKDFATRTLSDVDNDTLSAIAELLEDSERYD
ncbi:hypothetical protein [Arthrobacter castelli]|uniref:hypothetical protein n=1 Tax=Arthrobacter castelli TaxID=271431 RepID=UPI0012DF1A78|nr:hypothetical protein [Arthrobacter castelli]